MKDQNYSQLLSAAKCFASTRATLAPLDLGGQVTVPEVVPFENSSISFLPRLPAYQDYYQGWNSFHGPHHSLINVKVVKAVQSGCAVITRGATHVNMLFQTAKLELLFKQAIISLLLFQFQFHHFNPLEDDLSNFAISNAI